MPTMPSMSAPRWVWASKISAPSGSSRCSSSSHCPISFWARCSGSSTVWSLCAAWRAAPLGSCRVRDSDPRRHHPLARAASRGARRKSRCVSVRGEGGPARRDPAPARDRACARGRVAARDHSARAARHGRAVRAGEAGVGDRARGRVARMPRARSRACDGPTVVPGRARRPPARERGRGRRRPRSLRRPATLEERHRAGRHPASAARVRGRARRCARASPAGGSERRRTRGRRPGPDVRAGQAGDRGRLRRPRRRGQRHDRLARRANRSRPQCRLRADRAERADRVRPLSEGQGDRLLFRHDAHVRRRRAVRRGEGVARAREGGARELDGRRQARRERADALQASLRPVSGGGLQDTAEQGAGRSARGRFLPFARPRRRARGARAAVDGPQRARSRSGRCDHDRAGLVPLRVRWCSPGGHRGRHEGWARGAHGLPVRPRALNTIDTMLLEERRYAPDPEFARQANAQPEIYERDWEEFWEAEGRNRITWFEPFTKLYEWEPPYAKWYLGGKLNVCFNCVDRHVGAGLGDKVAYYWEGEPEDDRRAITFAELQTEVIRFANALKQLGVRKGTAVGIYMGMVPELSIAMLACTRLGAPHTVVFGGFSADSLSSRLNDMECEVLITQDEGWRAGKQVPLKQNADEAVAQSESVENVVVLQRTGDDVPFDRGRD